jgi:hypothetical protein
LSLFPISFDAVPVHVVTSENPDPPSERQRRDLPDSSDLKFLGLMDPPRAGR